MANKYAVETAFGIIDKATAPLTKIGVKGNAVGKQLKKDFLKAQDQLTGIGKAAKKAATMIVAVGAAAAGAFAVKGVKDAIEFNTAFTKVSTVADTTEISLEKLSKGLFDVSNQTGIAAKELAEMQYNAITSGIKTADSVEFLSAAVKTSKASFTDSGIVIDSLTKVINAYGLEASEAQKIAGQMLITTNMGKTSFDALNSSLGKVLPTASRLNVSTDELFSSITALTANSIETPKAMKGLEKILEAVQNPSDKAAKAARKLGLDFSATALRSKGLAKFLEDIKIKTGGSESAIMELFGSVESLNAITVLTGKGADQFSEALNQMKDASGAVDTAFNKVMESPAERWGKIMNKIKNSGITLGTALLPIIEKVMAKVESFVDRIKDFDFQPIADKIAVVFDKIWGFANVIINLIELIWKLRAPILAVVGAIAIYEGGMLIAAATVNTYTAATNILKAAKLALYLVTGNQTKAMALYKAETLGASIQTMLFAARQKIAMGVGFVGSLIKQGAAFLALNAQMIASTVATIAHGIAQKAVAVASGIATAAQWALNAAMSANPIGLIILGVVALIAAIVLLVKNWDTVVAALKKAFSAIGNFFVMIWEGIKAFFSKVVDFVKRNAMNILNVILTILFFPAGVIMAVVRLIIKHWDKIKEALLKVWEGIKAVFNKVKDFIGGIFNKVKDGAGKAWEGIKTGADKLKNGAIETFNKVKDGAGKAFNKAKEYGGAAWEGIKEFGFKAWGQLENRFPGLANVISTVFNKVKDIISGIIEKIKDIFSGFKNFFFGLWDALKEGPAATLEYIKNAFLGLFESIKEKFFGFIDVIKNGWESVKGFFSGIGNAVGDFFSGDNKKNNIPQVENITPTTAKQITTSTVGMPPQYTSNINKNNQTITAAASAPTRPMTTAEQYVYNQTTNKDQVDISVKAEQGSAAKVTRQPKSPNVTVAASGGNR